jgi:hypothetical protein
MKLGILSPWRQVQPKLRGQQSRVCLLRIVVVTASGHGLASRHLWMTSATADGYGQPMDCARNGFFIASVFNEASTSSLATADSESDLTACPSQWSSLRSFAEFDSLKYIALASLLVVVSGGKYIECGLSARQPEDLALSQGFFLLSSSTSIRAQLPHVSQVGVRLKLKNRWLLDDYP